MLRGIADAKADPILDRLDRIANAERKRLEAARAIAADGDRCVVGHGPRIGLAACAFNLASRFARRVRYHCETLPLLQPPSAAIIVIDTAERQRRALRPTRLLATARLLAPAATFLPTYLPPTPPFSFLL